MTGNFICDNTTRLHFDENATAFLAEWQAASGSAARLWHGCCCSQFSEDEFEEILRRGLSCA